MIPYRPTSRPTDLPGPSTRRPIDLPRPLDPPAARPAGPPTFPGPSTSLTDRSRPIGTPGGADRTLAYMTEPCITGPWLSQAGLVRAQP